MKIIIIVLSLINVANAVAFAAGEFAKLDTVLNASGLSCFLLPIVSKKLKDLSRLLRAHKMCWSCAQGN